MAVAVAQDLGALRLAAAQAAQRSADVRRRYDAGELRPEVQFELQGIWPPPAQERKRRRLS